ncbi:MAG TPA: ArsI/CadI family heavy metal resistance metalloenzyme [Pirellulales bacterium]|nr:ArsI/CadI family heavy metal resistance metalloenzyme [Pirellulales bacterium]
MSIAEAAKPVENSSTQDTVVRFHLSLNVADLDRSRAFYQVLLGVEPAKVREDYAKFELDEPPLVLSLIPRTHAGGGALNHVGIRLADAKVLVAAQARLETAGYRTQREEGVACCYARQTKFWATDPDGTLWELYILHEDIDERGHDHVPEQVVSVATAVPPKPAHVVWQHLLVQPLPERIDHADSSVDEVQLQGTFNLAVPQERVARLLDEALRVLRPGGSVFVHALAADRPYDARPKLPGPAALVERVPLLGLAAAMLAAAGFRDTTYVKVGKAPCFVVDGIEMRELQLSASKPGGETRAPAGACHG